MPALLVLLLLTQEPPAPRLLGDELTAGVGVLGSGYEVHGDRFGDLQLAPQLTGRVLFGGFALDGGALLVAPLSSEGTGLSVTAALRVGWSGQRWSVLLGALGQWSDGASPAVQWLPTLRASVDLGPLGLTLGLFDHLGLVPAHLSFDLRVEQARCSIGWVAPIGLLASVDLPLADRFGARVTAFAYKLGNAEFALLTLAGTFGTTR